MQDTVKVASIHDAAIDELALDSENLADFLRTRDAKLVTFKQGAEPTWFVVRRIDVATFFDFVEAGVSDSEKDRRAFYAAVERIENLHGMDGQRYTVLNPSGERRLAGGGVMRHFTDREVGLVAPAFIQDIGNWARQRAFLAPGSGACYQPPHGLATVWAARLTWARRERDRALQSATSPPAATTPSEPFPSNDAHPDAPSEPTSSDGP